MIKKILKYFLSENIILFPVKCVIFLRLFKDYFYDFYRFEKYSATLSDKKIEHLEGKIIAHYHVIEKGLSYKNTRLGFGQNVVMNLLLLLQKYSVINKNFLGSQYVIAVSVIAKYINFHDDANYDVSKIKSVFEKINKTNVRDIGGTLELKKEDILNRGSSNFKDVALSRYSIRDFTKQEVSRGLIVESIKIAQKAPSVCNRQTSRVYIITDKDDIKKHLSYQNGNRGFGHKINKLLVVTSDLSFFHGTFERNQNFVDAGIFSMSLLHALHYLGLGAVTLNWCVDYRKDRQYREFAKINDSENIILMIGIGHLPELINVPYSARRSVEEIIKYV